MGSIRKQNHVESLNQSKKATIEHSRSKITTPDSFKHQEMMPSLKVVGFIRNAEYDEQDMVAFRNDNCLDTTKPSIYTNIPQLNTSTPHSDINTSKIRTTIPQTCITTPQPYNIRSILDTTSTQSSIISHQQYTTKSTSNTINDGLNTAKPISESNNDCRKNITPLLDIKFVLDINKSSLNANAPIYCFGIPKLHLDYNTPTSDTTDEYVDLVESRYDNIHYKESTENRYPQIEGERELNEYIAEEDEEKEEEEEEADDDQSEKALVERTPPPPAKDDDGDLINIIVNYVPDRIKDRELYKLFMRYGDVIRCKVILSKTTGLNLGYAFVKFRYRSQAELALLNMNGYSLYDKKLKVSVARSDTESKYSNLFVTNIPRSMSLERVEEIFGTVGELVMCRLLMNKDTNISLGKAFVRYNILYDAFLAVQIYNGSLLQLDTSPITVQFAQRPNEYQLRYFSRPGTPPPRVGREQCNHQTAHRMAMAGAGCYETYGWRIFMYNLPPETTSQCLFHLCAQFGVTLNSNAIVFLDNGACKVSGSVGGVILCNYYLTTVNYSSPYLYIFFSISLSISLYL